MTTTAHYSPRVSKASGAELRPGSYERISHFTEGRTGAEVERGVDRQYRDACKATETLGLPEPVRYTDNDQSASEFATKERERWPEFLDDIRAGRINRPMFWLFDRAFRTTEAADQFLKACREGGALIVQTGGWAPLVANPHDPSDVKRMKDAASQAEYEVAVMSLRQRRHKEAMAEAGVSHGGRRRFGYTKDWEEHPTEAPVVRALVTRLLAGESLMSLAKWLNETGVPTPTTEERLAKGKEPAKWTGPNLRGMLAGPHLAGLRVHHQGREDEAITKAKWPAIIPPETHDEVVRFLANPTRRPKGSGNTRKYLLPTIMVCDVCGAGVRSRPEYVNTHRGRHVVPASYSCPTGRHVHRPMEPVDRVVELAIVERLTQHDASGLFVADEAGEELARLRDAREAVEARLAEYEEEAPNMSAKAYAKATNRLEAELDALDVQIIEATTTVRQASRVLKGAIGPEAALKWFGPGGPDGDRKGGWPLARRRAIIAEVAEVRLKGGRGNNTAKGTRFDPRDVDIRFRD
jgi:DNA invertase Pin-like site-specific DNA recombinase